MRYFLLIFCLILAGCDSPFGAIADVSSNDLKLAQQTFFQMANDVDRIADKIDKCK